MIYSLVTGPASEPVSVSDIKTLARIEHTIHDTLIAELITSCRQWVEGRTDICFVTQQWKAICNGFPLYHDFIELWKHPISAIYSVQYYDYDNTLCTMDADDYYAALDGRPAMVALNQEATWPTEVRYMRSVEINFTAGFGDAGSDCPSELITGLKNMIVYVYENPGTLERFSGDWSKVALDLKFVHPYLVKRI